MSKVVLVCGEDWEGLYIDGKRRRESHMLTADVVLGVLGIECEYVHVEDNSLWEQWDNHCPQELATVRKDLVRGWPG